MFYSSVFRKSPKVGKVHYRVPFLFAFFPEDDERDGTPGEERCRRKQLPKV